MASTPTALTTRGNDKSRWCMIRLGAQTDARKFEQFRLYSVGDVPSSPGEGGTFLPPPRNKRGFGAYSETLFLEATQSAAKVNLLPRKLRKLAR